MEYNTIIQVNHILIMLNFSVQVKVLTCDKLSHCLFDFDCVDLNIYERETYNYDQFEISDLYFSNIDSSEKSTHDSKIIYIKIIE